MNEANAPKYALKHFLLVGIVCGWVVSEILVEIIMLLNEMFLFRAALSTSPWEDLTYDIIASTIVYVIILCSIYFGNMGFAKLMRTNFISKEQILRSTFYFAILGFIILTFHYEIPSMKDAYLSCWSSVCKEANPIIATIPAYFMMYLLEIAAYPLGFFLLSRKYFVTQ